MEGRDPVATVRRVERKTDLTVEVIKQQIALSTVVIGAVAAFKATEALKGGLRGPLVALAFTVLFGVVALMCIAGSMRSQDDPTLARHVCWFGMLQNAAFLVGVIWIVIAVGFQL